VRSRILAWPGEDLSLNFVLDFISSRSILKRSNLICMICCRGLQLVLYCIGWEVAFGGRSDYLESICRILLVVVFHFMNMH